MYNGTDPSGYNPGLKKVPVIVSVSADGQMIPLYFSYGGKTFRLDRLTSAQTDCPPYLRYSCELTREDTVHRVELIYNTREHAWLLDLGRCS